MSVILFTLLAMPEQTPSSTRPTRDDTQWRVTSPDQKIELCVGVQDGALWYCLIKSDEPVVEPSFLGIELADGRYVGRNLTELAAQEHAYDETWEQPWGEQRLVRNNYRELALSSNGDIPTTLRFRVFDDGLGFRYELGGTGDVIVREEHTEFSIDPRSEAWWIPSYQPDRYEYLYEKTTLDKIPTAHTPFTVEHASGLFISLHEAALYDYGSMNIHYNGSRLASEITPLSDGTAAHISLPFSTPWRTVLVADTLSNLAASRMILNLNEPSKIQDTSWIRPTKFMGIWWGMFTGIFTWESGPRHGATTEHAKTYIDACVRLNMPALLIEGWNEGWDGNWIDNGHLMNQTKPYADFDIRAVAQYAQENGIQLVGHHETAGDISHYESQLPAAYEYYQKLGVRYVKTGYVGSRMNGTEFHHSQFGVRHYQKTVEYAAKYGMMLDIHEPIKPTGIERTWPNILSREGARGQEYEGGGLTPEHTTVLPFTRMLASGGYDFTPGIFDITNYMKRVGTTLAKQLAFYVTQYSAMQMVADMPEHYEGNPAFRFLQDVPCDWETSFVLDGRIGDFVVTARKDRASENWFVGAVSDEQERTVVVNLDFLDEQTLYEATVYQDGPRAHWRDNPLDVEISRQIVRRHDSLHIRLAAGGGCALALKVVVQ